MASDYVRITRVKLPKLTPKSFSGEIEQRRPFWDSFESAIDHNVSLSEVDKFNYLRYLLTGKVAEAVAGLSLTADNYKEAVAVLKRRYGNAQVIIGKHLEILLNLEAVSDGKVGALRKLYNDVEIQVRSLRSLGVESASYGTLLSSVVMTKVPLEVRLIINRAVGKGSHLAVDDLMTLFVRELGARERSGNKEDKLPKASGRETAKGHGGAATIERRRGAVPSSAP